ncbi:hypothetical protein BN903_5 [Halorubrum sp. AJ67]|nr:hypothetical protein BN903_5 [Halorubrum sp. AJ67]
MSINDLSTGTASYSRAAGASVVFTAARLSATYNRVTGTSRTSPFLTEPRSTTERRLLTHLDSYCGEPPSVTAVSTDSAHQTLLRRPARESSILTTDPTGRSATRSRASSSAYSTTWYVSLRGWARTVVHS